MVMDYARQQRDPAKHAIGIGFVVLFHVLLIYALINGLGRAIVEVVKKPLTATIIEELKLPPPPPPPPKKVVEQPKQQPQETYVPPPDVPVATSTAPTITATTSAPPTEQHVIQAPVVVAPPAPKPAIRRGVTKISGDNPEFPRAAQKDNISRGKVIARMNIDEHGNVTEVTIFSAEPARYFDRAVLTALKTWKFAPDGEKYVAEVEIGFKLAD